MGISFDARKCVQTVTHVPRLNCYLCVQTVPFGALTVRWTAALGTRRFAGAVVRGFADVADHRTMAALIEEHPLVAALILMGLGSALTLCIQAFLARYVSERADSMAA